MIEFIEVDLRRPQHGAFVYDVMKSCEDELLDDYDDDIVLLIDEMDRLIDFGSTKAYIVSYDNEWIGLIYLDIDRYNIGRLLGGMLPQYRNGLGRKAYKGLKRFIEFAFAGLKVRKIRAEVPTYNKRAERVLKKLGFSKEGLFLEETSRNGKPENVVVLGLRKSVYNNQEKRA